MKFSVNSEVRSETKSKSKFQRRNDETCHEKMCAELRARIGYLLIVLCVCVNTNLRGKPSVGKCAPWSGKVYFHANQVTFHMKGFPRGLVLKQRHTVTQKWSVRFSGGGMVLGIQLCLVNSSTLCKWPTGQSPSSWNIQQLYI